LRGDETGLTGGAREVKKKGLSGLKERMDRWMVALLTGWLAGWLSRRRLR